MGAVNFTDEFKRDAVAQITERGYPVQEVSERLGVSKHSLYAWKRKFAVSAPDESLPYVVFDARDKDVTMNEVLRLFDQAISGELAEDKLEIEPVPANSARPALLAKGLYAAE